MKVIVKLYADAIQSSLNVWPDHPHMMLCQNCSIAKQTFLKMLILMINATPQYAFIQWHSSSFCRRRNLRTALSPICAACVPSLPKSPMPASSVLIIATQFPQSPIAMTVFFVYF